MLPIIFESSLFTLYSYPLFMGLAWGFGYFYTLSLFEKHNLTTKHLNSLFIGLFISTWIGAKLFFLWFSSGPKIYQYLYANYFWLGGGFVFYGGLIFGLLFYFFWALIFKKFEIKNSAYLIPGLTFGHAIGRVGCFFTGCCYGALTSSFLGVKINGETRFPVQAYEAISLFIIGNVVLKLLHKKVSTKNVVMFYLSTYSIIRFILEFFRGDEIRGVYFNGLSSSQLVSIAIIFLIFTYLCYNSFTRKNN